MNTLTSRERQIIDGLKKEYAQLSGEAQADFVMGVSWAERHAWWVLIAAAVFGFLVGHFG